MIFEFDKIGRSLADQEQVIRAAKAILAEIS